MTRKIFRSTVLVAVAVLLCAVVVITGVTYNHFDRIQADRLQAELSLAATGVEHQGLDYLRSVDARRFRITWVGADGTVLYDTQANEGVMGNHGSREEILEALEIGSGSAVRYSDTLTEKTIYQATRLEDGSVLRISVSNASIAKILLGMVPSIVLVVLIAIVLSAALSHRMARRIVRPINTLDLEHPLQNEVYEEISPLLRRINRQNMQLEKQIGKLRQKSDEFQQVTENMGEGLVLLDKNELVLSINPAAQGIFGVDSSCIGRNFLTVDASSQLRNLVNQAYLRGSGSMTLQRSGRVYQIRADAIRSQGHLVGAVLLAVDDTQRHEAERTRREFSANVSHELKTPLQSIIGSAELMEQALVKPEDMPRFVGHIRREAGRLVTLVEDIIRLSQLDEGVELPQETVALDSLARETLQSLSGAAENAGVTLTLSESPCAVRGVRRLLYEILYNLCDNAIKYNVPGGRVDVTVGFRKGKPILQVADTGIGIAPEHQERIFERFYRVDKSHSKLSGGTGLGLSIVKHAASYHGATLSLESHPGQGTTITVSFP